MSNKVIIFGSCVTRDIFNYPESSFMKFVDIFARCNPISLLSPPITKNYDLTKNKSKFQQRMVTYDLQKTFFDRLNIDQYDYIIFDLIDTRFEVKDINGKYFVTDSNELKAAELFSESEVLPGWPSLTYKILYRLALQRMADEISKAGKTPKIVLNAAFWSDKYIDGKHIEYYTDFYIGSNNKKLIWCYEEFLKVFKDCFVIEYDNKFICAKKNHVWGEMPFHYEDSFYLEAIRQIEQFMSPIHGNNNFSMEKKDKKFVLSVDVEALPSRTSADDGVSRLMWGEVDGEFWGVPKIIDILDKYNISAVFFVEILSCQRNKASVFRLMKYIKSRGHDVGMHIHPELAPEKTSEDNIFAESVGFYSECFGTEPQFFRSGGLKYNKKTIEMSEKYGITVLSNYFINPYFDIEHYKRVPESFIWSNNVKEFPVHFCLDEALRKNNIIDAINIVSETIRDNLTHYFIHSWSFLSRDSNGHHDSVNNDYRTVFEKIIKKLLDVGEFVSMGVALESDQKQPVVPINWIDSAVPRRHLIDFSELAFEYPKLSTDDFSVGFCNIRISISEISVDELHRGVAPLLLPMDLQAHQLPYVVHLEKNGLSKSFYYVLSKGTAYLQMNREEFPFAEDLSDIFLYMKKYDSRVENVKFSRVIGIEDRILFSHDITQRGETYELNLIGDFPSFSAKFVSKRTKKEIDYCRRRLCRDYSSMKFSFYSAEGNSLCEEHIISATTMIEHRIEKKENAAGITHKKIYTDEWFQRNMALYLKYGFISFMSIGGVKVASYLGLYKDNEYYSIGAAFTDGEHSKFSVSKILFFDLIGKLYRCGCKKMHLGGGDFGYKTNFGAQAVSFCSGEIFLKHGLNLEELLSSKASYREINNYWGSNLTEIVYKDDCLIPYEDKNLSYKPNVCGWNGYQSAPMGAVQSLLQKVDMYIRDIAFFNFNTGFGFDDFALCAFPFKKHGGLFVEKCVYDAFVRNCDRLNVTHFSALLSENLSFDPEEISHYNVFFAYNSCNESVFLSICEKILLSSEVKPREIFFIYLNNKYDASLQKFGFKKLYEHNPGSLAWRYTSPGAIYKFIPSAVV